MQLSHSTQETRIWVTSLSYLTTWQNGLWGAQPVTKMQGERSLDTQKPQEQEYNFSLYKRYLKPKEAKCVRKETSRPLLCPVQHINFTFFFFFLWHRAVQRTLAGSVACFWYMQPHKCSEPVRVIYCLTQLRWEALFMQQPAGEAGVCGSSWCSHSAPQPHASAPGHPPHSQ